MIAIMEGFKIQKMERLVKFIFEECIYRIICFLKKREYYIPIDTTKDNIIRRNMLVNMICLTADILCIIITAYGWTQQIVTYIGMMTITMYIFVDHFKIYTEQYKKIKDGETCYIKHKQNKYLWWYTPNLGHVICSALIFIFLLVMTVLEKIEYYELTSNGLYRIIVIVLLLYMVFVKLKYYFLNTFEIEEYRFFTQEKL